MTFRPLILSILLILASASHIHAQDDGSSGGVRQWEPLFNALIDEEGEAQDWDEVYDLLCDLEANPVDITTATREDLERIPFLTDGEIMEILEQIYVTDGMLSEQEVLSIKSLTAVKRSLLRCFIRVGKRKGEGFPGMKTLMRQGENTFAATGNIPLYTRKGDTNGYLGYKYRHSIRFDHTCGEYLRIGIVGAQDAGEPFLSGGNSLGYDFYSFYLTLRKLGRIKNLTIGRYRIGMGMGLVMNNNLSFGKTLQATTVSRSATTIRPHSSRSAANYLQGAAATVSIHRNLDLTGFVSYRQFDATLNKDDGSIATILKNGYHRTPAEMQKKDNASHLVAGGNLSCQMGRIHLGASALYATLSRTLRPDTSTPYRRYYASGKTFYNLGLDYAYTNGRFSFHGETATGDCRALATINAIHWRLLSSLTLKAVQRYYSYKYHSLFARSFSEGGAVQNESGLYLGADWQPLKTLSLSYYADVAYFPWAKYQAKGPSHCFDNLFAAQYTLGSVTLAARYRLKIREKDNADKSALIPQTTQRARLSAGYTAKAWNVKTQFDLSSQHYKDDSFGYMATVSGGCTAIKKISVYASMGYFHTDGYSSRIYSYERGMAYEFSFPSYYGEGIRYSLFLSADCIRNLTLTAKAGVTDWFDRSATGTGLQQVCKSSLTDVQLQMKWRF